MSGTYALIDRESINILFHAEGAYLILQNRRGHNRQLILISNHVKKKGFSLITVQ